MGFYKIIPAIIAVSFSLSAWANTYVHGYSRQDGTYVQPHYRSNPNGNPNDNWSTKGNINPYTGQEGTKNPQNNDQSNR